jgi:hypothetical protein
MNLKQHIKKIIERETRPAVALSLRKIRDILQREGGGRHSTNTIAAILRELEYDVPDGRRIFVRRDDNGSETAE